MNTRPPFSKALAAMTLAFSLTLGMVDRAALVMASPRMAAPALTSGTRTSPHSVLAGLGGVMVAVAYSPTKTLAPTSARLSGPSPVELKKWGLSAELLQAELEVLLRRQGIDVYPHLASQDVLEAWRFEGEPTLTIVPRLSGKPRELRQGRLQFSSSVRLHQKVTLSRDPQAIISAPTWEAASETIVGATPQECRSQVRHLVQQFVSAYQEANRGRTVHEVQLPGTNSPFASHPPLISQSASWKTVGVGREPQVSSTGKGGATLELSAAPVGFPYTYQYGGASRTLSVNLQRYPVLVAYVNRIHEGSYAHLDVEARDAQGQQLQGRSTPTLRQPGLTYLDLGELWGAQPRVIETRLIVGGSLSGASCDYVWLRFVSREELARLQSQFPFSTTPGINESTAFTR